MNITAFKEAQIAYANGDYKRALLGFSACTTELDDLSPADLGKFYHLIGNCYIKNGDPQNAAVYYEKALGVSPESRKPSLFVNLGTALLNCREYASALKMFDRALTYRTYTTPYKAYSGVGAAQMKLGNYTEAGAAYREAALDKNNPAPAKALVNLGVCFMELGRAQDAITSYETALEFDLDTLAKAKAKANLGQAYMAEGRVQKAIDAFEEATDGTGYELSNMARHDYEIARSLKNRLDSKMPGILETGFIPKVISPLIDDAAEVDMPDSAFEPQTYGDDLFATIDDPVMTLSQEDEEPAEEEPEEELEEQPAEEEAAEELPAEEEAVEEEEAEELAEEPAEEVAEEPAEEVAEETAEEADAEEELTEEQLADETVKFEEPVDEEAASAETVVFVPVQEPNVDVDTGEIDQAETAEEAFEAAQAYEDEQDYEQKLPPSTGTFSMHLAAQGDEGLTANDFAAMDVEPESLPSPENTGFFDVSEQDIEQEAREGRRKSRKRRGVGLKVAITLVALCILVAAAACAAYVLGYGYPTQESVAEKFIAAASAGQDTSQYWADTVDEASQASQVAGLANLTNYSVEAVQRSTSQTVVYVKATVQEGGEIYYEVVMSRDGIGWAVEYVELYFPSEG